MTTVYGTVNGHAAPLDSIYADLATGALSVRHGHEDIALGGGSGSSAPVPIDVSADHTATTTSPFMVVRGSGHTITLPDPATCPGTTFTVKNWTDGDTTTVGTAAGDIDGSATYTGLAAAKACTEFTAMTGHYIVH